MHKNKNSLKKIYLSRLLLIVLTIVVLLLLFNAFSLLHKRSLVWKKVSHLRKEQEVLKDRKSNIENKLKDIDEGTGVEDILREKFNVVKPGEELIVLTEPKSTEAPPPPKKSFWQKIKSFFKKD